MRYTHVLLRKNFLQGDGKQQQSTKSPSNMPSADDKRGTVTPTDAVTDSGADNEIDGEYISFVIRWSM